MNATNLPSLKSYKAKIYSVLTLLVLLLMISLPKITLEGAKEGLILWFRNLLPALLPYTILSSYILGSNLAKQTSGHINQLKSQGFAVFTGLLCGYPLGAKITAQLVRNKQISQKKGQYLIGFCNLASPSFLISYVTAQCLGTMKYLPAILVSIYGSTLFTALLTYPLYFQTNRRSIHTQINRRSMFRTKKISIQSLDSSTSKNTKIPQTNSVTYTVNDAIIESFEAMIRLGGYLVLFSIIAKMVTALFTTVTTSHFFLIGVIEITKGVDFITQGNLPDITKLFLLSFCVAFGGLSCLAQTAGMCQNSGLSMPKYILTKLMNGCIAFVLMYLYCKINL